VLALSASRLSHEYIRGRSVDILHRGALRHQDGRELPVVKARNGVCHQQRPIHTSNRILTCPSYMLHSLPSAPPRSTKENLLVSPVAEPVDILFVGFFSSSNSSCSSTALLRLSRTKEFLLFEASGDERRLLSIPFNHEDWSEEVEGPERDGSWVAEVEPREDAMGTSSVSGLTSSGNWRTIQNGVDFRILGAACIRRREACRYY
jgi:hypothetical protein